MSQTIAFKLFTQFLKPFSDKARKKRMALFSKIMQPSKDMKILDLGGQPFIWDCIDTPLNITCLNLPGIAHEEYHSHHKIQYVSGNACAMPEFKPGDFDMVFSNSVIEHVGNAEMRKKFADEVLRLTNCYWIQTPCIYFPIEAHCGMPFWWFYPDSLRQYFLRKWRKRLPAWTEMVETTDVVTHKEFRSIFPNSKITHEWMLFPKSLIAYST